MRGVVSQKPSCHLDFLLLKTLPSEMFIILQSGLWSVFELYQCCISLLRFISHLKHVSSTEYLPYLKYFIHSRSVSSWKKFFSINIHYNVWFSTCCLKFHFEAFFQFSYSQCPEDGLEEVVLLGIPCKNVEFTLHSLQLPFNSILLYFQ